MSSSDLELGIISGLLQWNEDEQRREFKWLRLMSRFKFDAYSDFVAGARFTGSLIQWLRNFDEVDRRPAYEFMRARLQYVSAVEMRRLIEALYPRVIEPVLIQRAARVSGVRAFEIMTAPHTSDSFRRLINSALIVGMSEGAHLDSLRRANMEVLKHERMLPSVEMDQRKWKSVFKKAFKDVPPEEAAFSSVFLIDDFVGSGTTFFRKEGADNYDGKLIKLMDSLPNEDENWRLADETVFYVHHYIGSQDAVKKLSDSKAAAEARLQEKLKKSVRIEFSFGWILPEEIKVDSTAPAIKALVEKYYSRDIETGHNLAGGATSTDIKWGYKSCGLTLVLEHNTPNNTLPLFWAYSEGTAGRKMRPLFRRRQRHG